jgi:hypothetical protein
MTIQISLVKSPIKTQYSATASQLFMVGLLVRFREWHPCDDVYRSDTINYPFTLMPVTKSRICIQSKTSCNQISSFLFRHPLTTLDPLRKLPNDALRTIKLSDFGAEVFAHL